VRVEEGHWGWVLLGRGPKGLTEKGRSRVVAEIGHQQRGLWGEGVDKV